MVRVAVPREQDADALRTIVRESPIPVIADIHFNHTLALKALDAGAHCVRLNPGNIGGPEKVAEVIERAHRTRHAAAGRRQLRIAAQAPAPARVRQPGRGAGHRRGRDGRAHGAAELHQLQGVDEVDVGAEHDRGQPPAVRQRSRTPAPGGNRGGDEVVRLAEVGGRARDAPRRRDRRHDPDLALHLPRRGGGQGRLGDPQGAEAARARPGADRLSDLRPPPVRHGHRRRRRSSGACRPTTIPSRSRSSAARSTGSARPAMPTSASPAPRIWG